MISVIDSTKVAFSDKQFSKVIETLSQHPSGLSSGEIALLAACIGATAAILAQLIIFLLTRYKERTNQKRELIAEERRLAFLLTEYYKELVMHKVHKQYWYKTAELFQQRPEESKDSHKKHFESNQKSFETLNKIRITTSEYYKTITLYTNLAGSNTIIDNALINIKKFKARKSSDFSHIATYAELLVAQEQEEKDLNKVYLYYSDCFDKIHEQLTKN